MKKKNNRTQAFHDYQQKQSIVKIKIVDGNYSSHIADFEYAREDAILKCEHLLTMRLKS